MVETQMGGIGNGANELRDIYNNPNDLRCNKCNSLLDMTKHRQVNNFKIEVICPNINCREVVGLHRNWDSRKLNSSDRRNDGSAISRKDKGLSKKQRKSLRKQGKVNE